MRTSCLIITLLYLVYIVQEYSHMSGLAVTCICVLFQTRDTPEGFAGLLHIQLWHCYAVLQDRQKHSATPQPALLLMYLLSN